jgi:DNA-binding response OmpR family regulator
MNYSYIFLKYFKCTIEVKINKEVDIIMMERIKPAQYTLLIVDDDESISEMIQHYLKNKGFQILTAFDGKGALRVLDENQVHLLILDIMLPEVSGWEVCGIVRESSQIPILILTAKGNTEDRITGLTIGVDDYLAKPFDPNELVARVYSLLRRSYLMLQNNTMKPSFAYGPLKIDTTGHTVTIDGEIRGQIFSRSF